jgi:hypothetical protein
LPLPSLAIGNTYVQDTDLTVAGASLRIMAGSQADSLTTTTDSLTVTVADQETFIIRSLWPAPKYLPNDGGFLYCDITRTRDNQMVINGPKTVTITPSLSVCNTANYNTDRTPLMTLTQPGLGASMKSGDTYQVFWQTQGGYPSTVNLRLSLDGGLTYPTYVVRALGNDGFYAWTVPSVVTTDRARLKVEGIENDKVTALALSTEFHIEGSVAVPVPETPAVPTGWTAEVATRTAASINADRGFVATADSATAICASGLRIKARGSSAVYYCGADGKRHPFPNQKIHDSWFVGDFAGVWEVSMDTLAKIPMGQNVTYRPGVRMVKVTTDPKTYAVDANGTLRWVKTEAAAVRLYGTDWNKMIDDLPDAFFFDYKTGDPIE